jgi:hypothetical protein
MMSCQDAPPPAVLIHASIVPEFSCRLAAFPALT